MTLTDQAILANLETHICAIELALYLLTNEVSPERRASALDMLQDDLDSAKIYLAIEQLRVNRVSRH